MTNEPRTLAGACNVTLQALTTLAEHYFTAPEARDWLESFEDLVENGGPSLTEWGDGGEPIRPRGPKLLALEWANAMHCEVEDKAARDRLMGRDKAAELAAARADHRRALAKLCSLLK
tara:strand:- start:182 stop:535 length:354 start_codon:yes stop_codon:yes gene_type:complete